jgi:hypothetical protein
MIEMTNYEVDLRGESKVSRVAHRKAIKINISLPSPPTAALKAKRKREIKTFRGKEKSFESRARSITFNNGGKEDLSSF